MTHRTAVPRTISKEFSRPIAITVVLLTRSDLFHLVPRMYTVDVQKPSHGIIWIIHFHCLRVYISLGNNLTSSPINNEDTL